MMQAHQKARLTGNSDLTELTGWLAQSDNLHLIQWHGRAGSEAEVSAYFTPDEWWDLSPGGIIWEMQQVYKNFIDALDGHLNGPVTGGPVTDAQKGFALMQVADSPQQREIAPSHHQAK